MLHESSKQPKSTTEQEKRLLVEGLLDTREETKLLIEIKDIRDELQIMASILDTQKEVVQNICLVGRSKSRIRSLVESIMTEIKRMDKQATMVQDKVRC
jgi:glycerophosphoryl diester phosphodiesterase